MTWEAPAEGAAGDGLAELVDPALDLREAPPLTALDPEPDWERPQFTLRSRNGGIKVELNKRQIQLIQREDLNLPLRRTVFGDNIFLGVAFSINVEMESANQDFHAPAGQLSKYPANDVKFHTRIFFADKVLPD
jgi:hypothetical protein